MDIEFPTNFFFRQYNWLVARELKAPKQEGYRERHHIFPKSIYGATKELVVVSYKDHLILHYLLYRGFQVAYGNKHENTRKMHSALIYMIRGASLARSKQDILRAQLSDLLRRASERYSAYSPEILERMSERRKEFCSRPGYSERARAAYWDKLSEEEKAAHGKRMSEIHKGSVMTPERVELLRVSTTESWKDPEIRRRRQEGLAAVRDQRIADIREKWKDPVYKEAQIAKRKETMANRTPEQTEIARANMLAANRSEKKRAALKAPRASAKRGSM